jgi:hypothetical protein
MNTALEPEDNNIVKYERSPERRSGVDRRNGWQMKNKDSRQAAEKGEKAQPSAYNNFIGDFG